MRELKFDLVIRLDETGERFVFLTKRRDEALDSSTQRQELAVELPLSKFRECEPAAAEQLMGASVLGYFDNLTDGGIGLRKSYRDE
jgi:hypothetical protein